MNTPKSAITRVIALGEGHWAIATTSHAWLEGERR